MGSTSRRGVLLAGIGMGLALAGCRGLGVPASIDVSRERLQLAIERRFPIRQRVFAGVELVVGAPALTLLPEQNRIALACDLSAGEGALRRPVAGTLAISHGLAFDAADNSVHMVAVRVDRLELTGLDPGLQRALERPAAGYVQRLLEGQAVYSLRPQDVERLQAAGVVPSGITVTSSGITFVLSPRGL